jgi:undecaprenyl phosphate N,N'-diacetylbacillosamine 1-phosphate transferase
VEYVENLTFAMDVKVLKMTVKQVLGHSEDVAVDTNAIEGNFARIREERLARTGSLEEKPSED